MGKIRIIKAISSVVKPPPGGFFVPEIHALCSRGAMKCDLWPGNVDKSLSPVIEWGTSPAFWYFSVKLSSECLLDYL
jgi:hypothetical protein